MSLLQVASAYKDRPTRQICNNFVGKLLLCVVSCWLAWLLKKLLILAPYQPPTGPQRSKAALHRMGRTPIQKCLGSSYLEGSNVFLATSLYARGARSSIPELMWAWYAFLSGMHQFRLLALDTGCCRTCMWFAYPCRDKSRHDRHGLQQMRRRQALPTSCFGQLSVSCMQIPVACQQQVRLALIGCCYVV